MALAYETSNYLSMTTMNGIVTSLQFHDFDEFHDFDDLYRSEFVLFNKIANEMGVKMAILCPHQSFKDYLAFKPDISNIRDRISTYLANDLHEDSEFAKQISQMKTVCKTYSIEFELELMRDFFTYSSDCTYVSMDAFIKTLVTKSDNDHRYFIQKLITEFETTVEKKQKGEICKFIYEYLQYEALDYIKKTPRLKAVVIRKAYELKADAPDFTELIKSIDNFLTSIGAPLTDPSSFIEECPYCNDCDDDLDDDSDDSDNE